MPAEDDEVIEDRGAPCLPRAGGGLAPRWQGFRGAEVCRHRPAAFSAHR